MKKIKLLFVLFLVLLMNIYLVLAVEPFGATVTNISSVRAPSDAAQGVDAIAGNVTELNIFGYSLTQSWQGYFGNVTGTIMLADTADNAMYNWSLASPEGEVYASTNGSGIVWNYIQCLNFDSDGTYADDTANAGGTSAFGTNLTQLEAMFGIEYDDVDGVNETFTLLGSGHDRFYTNNFEFTEGECRNTQVFSNAGQGEDNKFEEVLLYEPFSRSIVFASLLEEANPAGFDGNPHDFEMLVLENGHLTDTSSTPYYFWIELE